MISVPVHKMLRTPTRLRLSPFSRVENIHCRSRRVQHELITRYSKDND